MLTRPIGCFEPATFFGSRYRRGIALHPSYESVTYTIIVRGRDASGQRFLRTTTVSNPGKSTLYFSLDCKVFQGSRLLVCIALPVVGRLAIRCEARRVDLRSDGTYAVLAKIMRYRSI